MQPSHVLVALDGSPLSEAALAHALDVFDCPVTVLNVVTPLDASMSESGVIEREERENEAREHADEVIEAAASRAAEHDQSVETVVEEGDPAETIVECADEHDVDQIVMGGHGGDANELTQRLLGTVATTVVREAPVTVTVVR
jgi:nucleotide-binding universal stress UspA family protein